ncbi:MAG: Smr/MutS family protein [Candidatus Rifleibacteriota bacterium]
MTNEIDLHGLQVIDALEAFINFYNAKVKKGNFSAISVIHGYGSSGAGGKINIKLRKFLTANESKLSFEPGEYLFPANPGITMVKPRKTLPSFIDALASEILEFCSLPRTKSKISGKFRRYGEQRIKASLTTLERNGLVKTSIKGKHKIFAAD